MMDNLVIHWFRQDLRLSDNPALTEASRHKNVLPIFILDDFNVGENGMGAASRCWLHHSLNALDASLNFNLSIYRGNPEDILMDIILRHHAKAVYWNRCYEPWRMQRDTKIKNHLTKNGIMVESYNGSLLWEPWTIKKEDDTPYKVFTPFYRKGCLKANPPRKPIYAPNKVKWYHDNDKSITIEKLELLPQKKWNKQLEHHWKFGEQEAHKRFEEFIDDGLGQYKNKRNFPDRPNVSKLSPHLHFGEISPNHIWYTLTSTENDENIDHFLSELGWREFSYSQLYQNPDLPRKNLQPKFDRFPWVDNEANLIAWQKGLTGVPMVDAGMRELWKTGYMHNRVRMIVGSFLVKNLRIHWRNGERWFWNTLVDADLANNSASWQWVAGCGADAAPYFRIFNPVTQGQKFDPDGAYVRRYVDEIAALPDKYLFNPWDAPQHILKEANIKLGVTYPKPVVDLRVSRDAALKAFQDLRIDPIGSN